MVHLRLWKDFPQGIHIQHSFGTLPWNVQELPVLTMHLCTSNITTQKLCGDDMRKTLKFQKF